MPGPTLSEIYLEQSSNSLNGTIQTPTNKGGSLTPILEQRDNLGRADIHKAARKGQAKTVEMLCQLDSNAPNLHDNDGMTPFHLAVRAGCLDVVKTLCRFGFTDYNQPDSHGRTPFHFASAHGHGHLVVALHQLGANVDQPDKDGRTPLHLAAEYGHAGIVTRLLLLGSKAAFMECASGKTPIVYAVESGSYETLAALLGFWSDGQCWNNGEMLLVIARQHDMDMVKLLIAFGAPASKDLKTEAGLGKSSDPWGKVRIRNRLLGFRSLTEILLEDFLESSGKKLAQELQHLSGPRG